MQLTEYYKNYYNKNGYSLKDNLLYSRVAFIKQYISDLCEKDTSILDIGCGDASLSLALEEHDYFGIDINISNAVTTSASVKEHDLTLFPYPFDEKYFSAIIISEVLEHMIDPVSILLEAHRLLKDDGHLIVSTPNANWIDYKLFPDKFTKAYRSNMPHTWEHIRHYDHFSFVDLFDQSKFKIVAFNGCDAHYSVYLSKARSVLLEKLFEEKPEIDSNNTYKQTDNLTMVDMLLGEAFPLDSHTIMFVCKKM